VHSFQLKLIEIVWVMVPTLNQPSWYSSAQYQIGRFGRHKFLNGNSYPNEPRL
jgi:hypothetical protein